MARRKGAPRFFSKELERGRVFRDIFRPSPSNPRRPGRPGIDFEIGGGPVGRIFPGFTQPGGGPDDFGRSGDVRSISDRAKRGDRLSGKYAWLGGIMGMPKGGGTRRRPDRFPTEKESASASPESFEALQKALSEARQEIQDLQNQKNSTAATPVKEEIIERKIKGYLGERPIYEDENIRFTDNNWEII